MRTKSAGIFLLVIGILMVGYTSFNFVTTEKVVDIGPLKIEKENNHFIQWPPIVGGLLAASGIALLFVNRGVRKQ
jgi:hypothetical protein